MLVLCRAGAATLSELAALGKASILVPLPPAIGNSPQEANAAMFGRKEAAQIIRDADLSPQLLVERVLAILSIACTFTGDGRCSADFCEAGGGARNRGRSSTDRQSPEALTEDGRGGACPALEAKDRKH